MLQNMLVGTGKEKYDSLNILFPTTFLLQVLFAVSFPPSHPQSMNPFILSPERCFDSWRLSREDSMDADAGAKEAQVQGRPGGSVS